MSRAVVVFSGGELCRRLLEDTMKSPQKNNKRDNTYRLTLLALSLGSSMIALATRAEAVWICMTALLLN